MIRIHLLLISTLIIKGPHLFKATNLYGTLKLSDFGKIAFTSRERALEKLKEYQGTESMGIYE